MLMEFKVVNWWSLTQRLISLVVGGEAWVVENTAWEDPHGCWYRRCRGVEEGVEVLRKVWCLFDVYRVYPDVLGTLAYLQYT